MVCMAREYIKDPLFDAEDTDICRSLIEAACAFESALTELQAETGWLFSGEVSRRITELLGDRPPELLSDSEVWFVIGGLVDRD